MKRSRCNEGDDSDEEIWGYKSTKRVKISQAQTPSTTSNIAQACDRGVNEKVKNLQNVNKKPRLSNLKFQTRTKSKVKSKTNIPLDKNINIVDKVKRADINACSEIEKSSAASFSFASSSKSKHVHAVHSPSKQGRDAPLPLKNSATVSKQSNLPQIKGKHKPQPEIVDKQNNQTKSKTPVNHKHEGSCPFCQMPLELLLIESPRWHVMECMDLPIKATEECPAGNECDNTIPNHYRRFQHTALANSRAGLKATHHEENDQSGLKVKKDLTSKGKSHRRLDFSNLKKRHEEASDGSSPHGQATDTKRDYRSNNFYDSSVTQPTSPYFTKVKQRVVSTTKIMPSQEERVSEKTSLHGASRRLFCVEMENVISRNKGNSSVSVLASEYSDDDIFKNDSDDSEKLKKLSHGNESDSDIFGIDKLIEEGKNHSTDTVELERDISDMFFDASADNDQPLIKSKHEEIAEDYEILMCEESEEVGSLEVNENRCTDNSCEAPRMSSETLVTEIELMFGDNSEDFAQQAIGAAADADADDDLLVRIMDDLEQEDSSESQIDITKHPVNDANKINSPVNVKNIPNKEFHSPAIKQIPQSSQGRSPAQKQKTPRKGKLQKPENNMSILSFFRPNVPKAKAAIAKKISASTSISDNSSVISKKIQDSKYQPITNEATQKQQQRTSKANPSAPNANAAGTWDGFNEETEPGQYKRRCPFYKKMPGAPFTVDAFRYGEVPGCRAYFLSHFHYDHYAGLTKKFKQPIYCSKVTANLVLKKIRVDSRIVHPLPMNTPCMVEGVEVTLLEANHCPGSVLFVFILPDGRKYLHTGDFRADPSMETYPQLINTKFQQLYLDTTYCMPEYAFPPQSAVIDVAVKLATAALYNNPNTLIVVGSYTIGKERIFLAIAEALNCKICVQRDKKNILDCLEEPSIDKRLTLQGTQAKVHVLPMRQLNYQNLSDHLSNYKGRFDQVLALEPTGWTHNRQKSNNLDNLKPKFKKGNITVYGVPYSEHSSFTELKRFVQYLRPEQILPTVNNGNPASRRKMEKLFAEWLSEAESPSKRLTQTSMHSWMKK